MLAALPDAEGQESFRWEPRPKRTVELFIKRKKAAANKEAIVEKRYLKYGRNSGKAIERVYGMAKKTAIVGKPAGVLLQHIVAIAAESHARLPGVGMARITQCAVIVVKARIVTKIVCKATIMRFRIRAANAIKVCMAE